MNIDLIHEFVPGFSNLLQQHGFKKIEEIYRPEEFGNALIKMVSSDFQLRFFRDRSQVVVDIAPPSTDRWHKLEYVLEFVDSSTHSDDFGSPPDIDKLAKSLEKNYHKVRELFSDNVTQLNFEHFVKTKAKDFINRIFRTQ
jgi:hypothetical protein